MHCDDDVEYLAQVRARRLALCEERQRRLAKWRAALAKILARHPGVRHRLIARGRLEFESGDD